MTAAMLRTARAVTTGHQLLGQHHGPATHVGPNALLRISDYPDPTVTVGNGPATNGPFFVPAIPPGADSAWRINGFNETDPDSNGLCCNWAGGSVTAPYVYNNKPGNLGGVVQEDMLIDGWPVPAGTYVFQFMDLSFGGSINAYQGVGDGYVTAPNYVIRGCRFRAAADATGFAGNNDGSPQKEWFLYCDMGGYGHDPDIPTLASACLDQRDGGMVIYRNYISMIGSGMFAKSSNTWIDIYENYIEQICHIGGQHLNGISFNGDEQNCRVTRNRIVTAAVDLNGADIQDTDAIGFFEDSGGAFPGAGANPDGTVGYYVTGNYMGGFGYCVYPPAGAQGNPNNFHMKDNLITTSSYPVTSLGNAPGGGGGFQGPIYTNPGWWTGNNTQHNNLWADGPYAGQSFIIGDAPILFGITVDDVTNVSGIVTQIQALPFKPTVRIYFDIANTAADYSAAITAIHPVAYIMGLLLDSSDEANISTADYSTLVSSYLSAYADVVDIWEIGNEVNGDWTENGFSSWDGTYTTVIDKLTTAYDLVKAAGCTTALTLYANYYAGNSKDGHTELSPEDFTTAWMPGYICNGLDYVLLSYYVEDNASTRPDNATWATKFTGLHALYPNSWLGFGEVGQDAPAGSGAHLTTAESLAGYYYGINPGLSYYCGGYFWWNWYEDAVTPGTTMRSYIISGFNAENTALG